MQDYKKPPNKEESLLRLSVRLGAMGGRFSPALGAMLIRMQNEMLHRFVYGLANG